MCGLEEILALHDLSKDPQAGSAEAFERRSRLNFQNRCLHHHVFDQALAADMVRAAGFDVRTVDVTELMKAESGVTCSSLILS